VKITDHDFTTPLVIDDALPEQHASFLESVILGSSFPWSFVGDVSTLTENKPIESVTYAFMHLYAVHGQSQSSYYDLVKLIPSTILQKIGINTEFDITMCRSFLHVRQNTNNAYDQIHRDDENDHIVLLYYVNDTDGDTHIFGTEYEFELFMRVTPKKNRAVIFNGNRFHASSSTNTVRAIINYNLI